MFMDFEEDLNDYFKSLSLSLKDMYERVSIDPSLKTFDTIFLYITDLEDFERRIQLFCKSKNDPPEYWDFRGRANNTPLCI